MNVVTLQTNKMVIYSRPEVSACDFYNGENVLREKIIASGPLCIIRKHNDQNVDGKTQGIT